MIVEFLGKNMTFHNTVTEAGYQTKQAHTSTYSTILELHEKVVVNTTEKLYTKL